MKKNFFTLFLLISLFFLSACSNEKNESKADTVCVKPSFHKITAEMIDRRAPFDSTLIMQQKAVEELRNGTSEDNPVDVLQQMGYLYCRTGQYDLGTDFLLEAVDSLDHHPPVGDERGTAAYLFGNLANQYIRMNMYDEALQANRRALKYSEGLSPMFACNLWRMRGNLFQHIDMPDSVLRCYDIALTQTGGDERLATSIRLDRGEYIVIHNDKFSDGEVLKALQELENTDYTVFPVKNAIIFAIGKGKIIFGDTVSGIRFMEDALESSRERQDVEMIQYSEKHLLHAYAKAGMTEKLARMFAEYDSLCDTLMNREKINSVIASEFRFRAKKKDMETQMWKERSASARNIIILQWLAISLAVLLASLSIIVILGKLRSTRKSRENMRKQLISILDHQKEVNATIERLNTHIEELNKEIEGRNDTENIQKLITEMPSSLLSDKQEALFRRYFSQIYPRFIPALRRDYPSITANDELIAMLIFMDYSSEEIALSLGISKQSVNSARYRLRKKLNLDRETDLNSFLSSRKD